MPTLNITEDQARAIAHGEESPDFDVVEEGAFEETDGRGKYQAASHIFSPKGCAETGPFYVLAVTRSGSYYTEWDYDYDLACPEVRRVTKTTVVTVTKTTVVTEWVAA